jgi:acyl dehydratase
MAREVVELPQAPGTFDTYRKAVTQRAHGQDRVPEKVLRLSGQVPTADQVADYCSVVGERLGSILPPLYPHLIGFPLQMALMTDGDSPFPAIGLVHVANEMTTAEPIPLGAPLAVEVEMLAPRPHRRGRTVDLVARVTVDGDDEVVWRSVSTYLRRENTRNRADGEPPAPGDGDRTEALGPEPLTGPGAVWALPGDLGRQYGSVSGDRNPIHLSSLTARAFGFKTAIAHGMWTAARCLAQEEGRLPRRYRNLVEFKQPIPLPGRVEFVDRVGKDGVDFQVRSRRTERLHLIGNVTGL